MITDTLETKCPNCEQKFSEEGFHIAIFLYGIFFLVGREIGYAGITCPTCLTTFCNADTVERTIKIKELMSDWIQLGDSTFRPHLRYFSSVGASPKDIPAIGAFDTYCVDFQRIQNDDGLDVSISDQFDDYQKKNAFSFENHLCSFIPDQYHPIGTNCYVWWFKKSDVEKLLRIENSKGIKVFPRYYHRCSLIEKVDSFCWKNYLSQKDLDDLKNKAAVNLENIEQEANYLGIDEKLLLESIPGTLTPNVAEYIIQNTKRWDSTEVVNIAGDFFNILVSDPEPWNLTSPLSIAYKGFWKTKNPFTTVALPLSLTRFSPHPFKEAAESQWLHQAKSDIIPEFTKAYVQTYLMENYASFIREYAEINKSRSFCYADLWILKEKYLKELHALVKEQTKVQNKNLFYQQNGFWVVSYNGNESIIQNLDGMKYIHFLLQHKGKKYTYFDIEKLLNGEVAKEDGEDEEVHIESEIIDREFIFSLTPQEMITEEFLDEILREREKVSEKLRKAEKNGDKNEYIELNSCLEKIDSFLKDSTYKSKKGKKTKIKIKKFKDSKVYKVKKDNVDRVLNYALDSLEEHNEIAYKHFEASIKNKRGELWYEPAVDTAWHTG